MEPRLGTFSRLVILHCINCTKFLLSIWLARSVMLFNVPIGSNYAPLLLIVGLLWSKLHQSSQFVRLLRPAKN